MNTGENLENLLYHLAFVISRQSDQVLQERLGIGFSQLKIIQVLQEKPHIQQKEIANQLGQTEASISRQIKLLISQGLLQSLRRSEDRREHITTLTVKGERYADEARQIVESYHKPLFDTISQKEHDQLLGLLSRLHLQICDH
ncbi:winged helix-turn-helix transcriptional regulator [Candidatus Saccharibacteria bacterium]|nr:winged helix-turn-helix transcriptional regulator [Candidatus Saccharibacteria bacterium]